MAETVEKSPIATETRPEAKAPAPRTGSPTPFEAIRREMERMFEEFGPAGWRLPFRRPSAFEMTWPSLESWPVAPAMDMVDRGDAYEISAELPGLDEKDVEIGLSNGNLSIKGEKKQEKEEREGDYYLSERRFGAFQRVFRVPADVDQDRIDASFRNGVLTVALPKSPAAKQDEKRISVKAG